MVALNAGNETVKLFVVEEAGGAPKGEAVFAVVPKPLNVRFGAGVEVAAVGRTGVAAATAPAVATEAGLVRAAVTAVTVPATGAGVAEAPKVKSVEDLVAGAPNKKVLEAENVGTEGVLN